MPVVLKIDGSLVELAEDCLLTTVTKIRKKALDVVPGTSAIVWSHYSQPRTRDGQLIAVGVVTRSVRSDDEKSVDLSIALSPCPPLRDWRTEDHDELKNRNDETPETDIANEVRGYTHDHVGHVSEAAAALMANYFI